jgi:hypothetical protein
MRPEEIQRLPAYTARRRIIETAGMMAKEKSLPKGETIKIDFANELDPTGAKPAELEKQVAKLEYELAWFRVELVFRENELAWVREELARRENENCSLQTSFDLIVSENSRLSRHLAERDVASDYARSQLELIMAALREIKVERNKLATTLDKQNDSTMLSVRLGAIPSPAAEKLAAEFCQVLLAGAEEGNAAGRMVAGETVIKLDAHRKSLLTKQCQLRRFEQSRRKLIENSAAMLLAHTITF